MVGTQEQRTRRLYTIQMVEWKNRSLFWQNIVKEFLLLWTALLPFYMNCVSVCVCVHMWTWGEEKEDAICLSNWEVNTLLFVFENIPNQNSLNSEENICHDPLILNTISNLHYLIEPNSQVMLLFLSWHYCPMLRCVTLGNILNPQWTVSSFDTFGITVSSCGRKIKL